MEFRIIKSPTKGTLDILERRKGSGSKQTLGHVGAVGLVQGRLIRESGRCHGRGHQRKLPAEYDIAGDIWRHFFGRVCD